MKNSDNDELTWSYMNEMVLKRELCSSVATNVGVTFIRPSLTYPTKESNISRSPWIRVLLEKRAIPQVLEKLPVF